MTRGSQRHRNILLVGAPETCPDIQYASGFRAPDPVVFLQKGNQRYLVVSPLEIGRARREAKHVAVFTPEDIGVRRQHRRRFANWATAIVRTCEIGSVYVPDDFPVGISRRLTSAGIRVHVSQTPLYPERAVKTPREITHIRESQQAAVIAMRGAVAAIAASEIRPDGTLVDSDGTLTSESIRQLIGHLLLDHQCVARDIIVACGPQGADPHERGHGPLHAHQPIVIDIFPQHMDHGYWGDLTRTVVRGEAEPDVKRMYQSVRAAQQAALNMLRSRISCRSVHAAVAAEFDRRGFFSGMDDGVPVGFTHGTGHGVGLGIHEAPSLAPVDQRLRSGHVVTVEPGLYYPDLGGVRIEDTVCVTSTGWKYLVPCEKRLEY